MSSVSKTIMLCFLNKLLSLFAYASRSPAGTDLAAKYINCNDFAGISSTSVFELFLLNGREGHSGESLNDNVYSNLLQCVLQYSIQWAMVK